MNAQKYGTYLKDHLQNSEMREICLANWQIYISTVSTKVLTVCMKEGSRLKKELTKGFEILSLFRLQVTTKLRNGLQKHI